MKSFSISKDSLIQRWKSIDESWRFALAAFVSARLFYGIWSWAILTAYPLAVQNLDLFGKPVVAVFSLHTSQSRIYVREINGQTLTFRPASANAITDLQTNSVWDISTGAALNGQFNGSSLLSASISPENVFPYYGVSPYPVSWLAIWQRFDANWYISIAEYGYGKINGADHYPPLFPALINLLMPLFGHGLLAGLFISHLATLYAIKLLHELFSSWGGSQAAKYATALLLISPGSFFLFSAYTESLFLVVTLLSLRCMKTGSWVWAGFWTFCAILTRLQGAALLIPMSYLMWMDPPFLRKFSHWFGLSLPGAGGMFYLFLRSQQAIGEGLPLVETPWRAHVTLPGESYIYAIKALLSGHFIFVDLLNWAVATFIMALIIAGWKKTAFEYNLFSIFSLLIILSRYVQEQPLISMTRYALTLFPVYFTLGTMMKRPWSQRIIVYTCLTLNLYLSAQFFTWGWVA